MNTFIAATVLLILVGGVYPVPLGTGTNEEGVPSESYLQEVREQLEEREAELEEQHHQREAWRASDHTDKSCNSTTPTSQAVRHGSTVALQSVYSKNNWLGCSTTTTSCANSRCPGLYMDGQDWNRCRQNVFQIFRAQGHGDVKVGDLVGLYLTRESGKWIACHKTLCVKGPCAGIASYVYGFDEPEKWYRCYAQVFKIYARGKQLGETIYDRDHIMLFYLQALNWIGADGSTNHHRSCPGSTRPPPPSKYDSCYGTVYEIWKK